MDEKERIERIIIPLLGSDRKFTDLPARLLAGVEAWDDCAVLQLEGNTTLVVTTDFIRGTGFDLYKEGLLGLYDLGFFLVVANLSDVAAMGAVPLSLLTVVRYPLEMSDDEFMAVFEGMKAACQLYNTPIIGGDTGGADSLVLSATAIGICRANRPLMRSGAQPGDLLCLTGPVGGAATALAYFRVAKKRGLRLTDKQELEILNSWRRPTARVLQGRILSENGFGTSCQDVSDGLRATVVEIGQVSHTGSIIDEQMIPIRGVTYEVADFLRIDPCRLAFSASVDFELLFSVPPTRIDDCRKTFTENSCDLHVIGRITETPQHKFRRTSGEIEDLPGISWRHQAGDVAALLTDPDS